MRARSYDHRQPFPQNCTNSHFLGLECVLDKYQHQNHILCKKIDLLLSQNKRLKEASPSPYIQNPIADTISKQPSNSTHNQVMCHKSSNRKGFGQVPTLLDSQIVPISKRLELLGPSIQGGIGSHHQRIPFSHPQCQDAHIRKQSKSLKYSEFNSPTRILEPRVEISDRQKQGRKNQEMPHQKAKIFSRQVYLESETLLVDEEEDDKLPTFIEASFGNLDFKQTKQQQKKIQILRNQPASKDNKMMLQAYRLEKTEEQKKQMAKMIVKLKSQSCDKETRNWGKQRQESRKWQGKKTNYPYIKQDYKLAQPKTQLGRIQRSNKQEKENKQNLDVRKTFLHVMSKKPKKSLFSK